MTLVEDAKRFVGELSIFIDMCEDNFEKIETNPAWAFNLLSNSRDIISELIEEVCYD